MSSNPQAPPPAQQPPRYPKPPFADWPTIKILTPPQGPFLPKIDEWCFTVCSQTVSGRINSREPNCRSVCIRKVFPHEVRNILSFPRHRSVDSDGKAHYLLPAEGQAENLPRAFGGQAKDASDESPSTESSPTKHWDEGWYFWTAKGRQAFLQKTEKMMADLPTQQKFDDIRTARKEVWHDYQQQLQSNPGQSHPTSPPWWAPIVPPKSIADAEFPSLLVHLPPDTSAIWNWGRVTKLLAPSFQVLDIFQESISAGEHKEFALRVWEKAKTEEPWILARRCLTGAYEKWKKPDVAEEDDEKKGST